jgi:hypothetical protein
MPRRVEFRINASLKILLNIDDYGAVLYYAYTVNQNLALQLYKAMVSEYYYKLETNMPLEELTETNTTVYIAIHDLPQVTTFLDSQVIPSLQLLPLNLDLTTTWDIGDSFEGFLMRQGSFFDYFNIDDIDQDGYTVEYFIAVFSQFRDFFQDVVSQNVTYTVIIV